MRSRIKWTALLSGCFAASLFFLAYPIYVIRPFRHQDAAELRLALEALRFRPIAMIVAVALAAIAGIQYWRTVQVWWRRALAVTAGVAVLGFAALSRINIYELMFHPIDRPEFVEATATKLDGAEKVLAIHIGDEARAYPIRSISYHHVVNDRLGGVPIAATY
jgi:Protein of unknown function (DUF3179)